MFDLETELFLGFGETDSLRPDCKFRVVFSNDRNVASFSTSSCLTLAFS